MFHVHPVRLTSFAFSRRLLVEVIT